MKWEHILLIILVGALVYFWITWPKPKPDERVKEYQQVIDDQRIIIDSLQKEVVSVESTIKEQAKEAVELRKRYERTIAKQRQQLKENETIHQLPTPELDSIVRELYGKGAI